MSNEIVWYDSSETGAPVLNNVAGSMLAVLDACLLNGFNVKSVTSIVVAANEATVTCASHGYSNAFGKLVKVAGALPAGLNGRKQITVTGVNTFTFPTTDIADQTATGTISARRAPLETWEKPYSGVNKAMYRSTEPGASGALLRIVDTLAGEGTAAVTARVRMVETATDVDTFTTPCPTDTQLSGGGYWLRGTNTATAKTWRLLGDGRFFYFLVQMGTTVDHAPYYFGDFLSYKAADSAAAIVGYTHTNDGTGNNGYAVGFYVATSLTEAGTWQNAQILRGNNGITTSTPVMLVPSIHGLPSGSGRGGMTYPSPVTGGFVIAYPNDFMEGLQGLRGQMPGVGLTPSNLASVPDLTIFSGLQNSARRFMTAYVQHATSPSIVLFDLTGPWR